MTNNFQFGEFWIKVSDEGQRAKATVHDYKTDEQLGMGEARTIEAALGAAVLAAAEVLQRRQR
jgi:MYXO-CTERM domain-containing protein